MAGAALRAGWFVRLAAPSASYCTRFGAEVPAAAAQAPQPSPPYGSRKPHARRVPAEEEPAARAFSSAPAPGPDNKSFLWARYGEMKRLVQGGSPNRSETFPAFAGEGEPLRELLWETGEVLPPKGSLLRLSFRLPRGGAASLSSSVSQPFFSLLNRLPFRAVNFEISPFLNATRRTSVTRAFRFSYS